MTITHDRRNDVLAAMAKRAHRAPATNLAEAAALSVMVELLLARLADAKAKIPGITSLSSETITALVVFIDDTTDHTTEAYTLFQEWVAEMDNLMNEVTHR